MPKPSDLSFYNWETQTSTSNATPNFHEIDDNEAGLLFKNKRDRKVINVDPKALYPHKIMVLATMNVWYLCATNNWLRMARDVSEQIAHGNRSIIGLMLVSHLEAGNQAIPKDLSALRYGVSVTDGCIDWATTESLVLELCEVTPAALKARAD